MMKKVVMVCMGLLIGPIILAGEGMKKPRVSQNIIHSVIEPGQSSDIEFIGTKEVQFEPANYKIDQNGDTILILPPSQQLIEIPYNPNENSSDDQGNIFFGNDVNITASSYNTGHPSLGVYGNYMFCAAENGASNEEIRVMKSTNGGVSWSWFTGFYHTSYTVEFPDVAVTNQWVVVTMQTNTGSGYDHAWSARVPLGGGTADFYYLDAQVPVVTPEVVGVRRDTFYAVAVFRNGPTDEDIRFYRTFNAGQNWNRSTIIGQGSSRDYWMPRIAVDPTNSNKIGVTFMVGADSVCVALSSNGGSSWSFYCIGPGSQTPRYPDIAIYGNTVVVVYDYGPYLKMHYTTNWGSSWNSAYYNNVPNPVEYPVIAVDGGIFLLAYLRTSDHKVYYYWFFDPTNLYGPYQVTDNSGSASSAHRPAVCRDPEHPLYGYVAWKDSRSSGDCWGDGEYWTSVQEVNLFPFENLSLNIFPSVVSKEALRIKIALPRSMPVNLSVYDINGTLINRILEGTYNAGDHAILWKAKGLKSGPYIIRLETPTFTESKKIILIKERN